MRWSIGTVLDINIQTRKINNLQCNWRLHTRRNQKSHHIVSLKLFAGDFWGVLCIRSHYYRGSWKKKLKEPLYEPVGVPFLVYLPTSWWVLMLCAVVYDIFRKTDITSVLKYITQLTFFIFFDYSSFLQIFMQIYKSTN